MAKFKRILWNLNSFEQVSYDKHNKVFIIYFFDGSQVEFSEIEEDVIFQFIISKEKEKFIEDNLFTKYPYVQHNSVVSKFS